MIPPTSIDGTDITGATIDGTDVQEITVDGDVVFSAAPTIIEDFESGNLNAYSGDKSPYTVQSNEVFNGTFALDAASSSNLSKIYSANPASGNTPALGDTHEIYFNPNNENDLNEIFGWASSNQEFSFNVPDGYHIQIREDEIVFNQATPSGFNTSFPSISHDFEDRWYKIKISGSSPIKTELFFASNNQSLGSTTENDNINGGLGSGIFFWAQDDGGVWDFWHFS